MRFITKVLRSHCRSYRSKILSSHHVRVEATVINLDGEYRLELMKSEERDYAEVDDWKVYLGTTVVGGANVYKYKKKNPTHSLEGVYLEVDHKNKGIGKELFKALVRYYGSLESSYVETSLDAERTWKSLGAKRINSKNERGQKRFRLEKSQIPQWLPPHMKSKKAP